jgi:hypothetical protein
LIIFIFINLFPGQNSKCKNEPRVIFPKLGKGGGGRVYGSSALPF